MAAIRGLKPTIVISLRETGRKFPNSSRQEKPRSRGGAAETARKNSVGSQSHPEKVSHRPEASLASSSKRAARSVDSECQSRVIESRKDICRWSLRRGVHGGNTGAPQRGEAPRSGRDLRAGQRCSGVLWEPGSTVGLLGTTNRSGCKPVNNTQALGPRTSRPRRANQRSQLKATWRNAEQAECPVGDYGRLSRFIVLLESRRTNRGSRGVRKGAIERQHQRWAPGPVLSDRSSVPVTTLDSTGAKLSFEEPYAGNLLVRVCGGAGGQPPALPGSAGF